MHGWLQLRPKYRELKRDTGSSEETEMEWQRYLAATRGLISRLDVTGNSAETTPYISRLFQQVDVVPVATVLMHLRHDRMAAVVTSLPTILLPEGLHGVHLRNNHVAHLFNLTFHALPDRINLNRINQRPAALLPCPTNHDRPHRLHIRNLHSSRGQQDVQLIACSCMSKGNAGS